MQVEGRNYLLPSGIAIDDPKARSGRSTSRRKC
jgi:hypothetical protein